jgi:RNA polymerase sigma-70 factor (ECF subfamily)
VPERWETIVHEHAPAVLGAAWRILGHAADAEDVTQEVFLEAYRKWKYRADDEWVGLLRRMAACRAIDRRRRRRPSAGSDELAEVAARGPGQAEIAVAGELICLLRKAIDQLPPREAEVFCLRYFEELTNAEISAALRMKPGAVAAALCKARAKLEQRLGKVLKGDQP